MGVKEGWEHEKRVHIMHARVGWREVRNVEGGIYGERVSCTQVRCKKRLSEEELGKLK